jgi:hypothetical protein
VGRKVNHAWSAAEPGFFTEPETPRSVCDWELSCKETMLSEPKGVAEGHGWTWGIETSTGNGVTGQYRRGHRLDRCKIEHLGWLLVRARLSGRFLRLETDTRAS